MKPDIWGSFMWYTIHFIALDYSSNPSASEKIDYKYYFQNLHKVIPCYKCAQHYIEHLREIPLTDDILKNNKSLFNWTVKLHNIVNKMVGKKIWNSDKAWEYYNNPNNFLQKNKNNSMTNDENKISNRYFIGCWVLFILLSFSLAYIIKQSIKNG